MTVPGRLTGFTSDGKALLVSDFLDVPDGTVVRSVIRRISLSDQTETSSEVDGGVVGPLGDGAIVVTGVDEEDVVPTYAFIAPTGERRTLDFGQRAGELVYVSPGLSGGRSVFLIGTQATEEGRRWGVMQDDGSKIEHFDDLTGFHRMAAPLGFVLLTDIPAMAAPEGKTKGQVALIDIEAGQRRTVTFDPGKADVDSLSARVAPDGKRLIVFGYGGEDVSWIIPLDGSEVEQIDGVFSWSPGGGQLLGVRRDGDKAAWFTRPLGKGDTVELGEARSVIWTPG
jgi:hypothetical protein